MIARIDHFVLTVASVEASCAFYRRVLGLACETSAGRPTALMIGRQKINLHQVDHTFDPKARRPTPGAGDFCLVSDRPVAWWLQHLTGQDVAIEEGPVPRTGAEGPMTSIYFRDPDGNLVEVSHYGDG